MTRDLSLRPTTLSLGSMFLLMECSKGSMHPSIWETFMRRSSWKDSSMDLTFSLLTMHGKKCISVLIDHFINYFHLPTIYVQYISPQEGKLIFGFHGHSRTNICDGDNFPWHELGKLWCHYYYSQLIYNAIYSLIVDGQACTTSNLLGDNLPQDVREQQLVKLCCIHWRNHWCHPHLQITLKIF